MTLALWDELHADERHRLRYPSEHVVRWLAGLPKSRGRLAVDIGCGHGRHLRLLEEFGWLPMGCDTSVCADGVMYGDMRDLPYIDSVFDVALAYGVFYYATRPGYAKAVAEMHRVLADGGYGLVVTRTDRDSRKAQGVQGAEAGMDMTFLSEDDVPVMFREFSDVSYELVETTRNNRQWRDSDWLIRVTK